MEDGMVGPALPARNPAGVRETGYIPDLFERISLLDLYPGISGRPKMVRCPAHSDDTPSLAIYDHNTHCMGGDCRFHETVIDHITRVFNARIPSKRDPRGWREDWPKFFRIARRILRAEPVEVLPELPPPLDPAMPEYYHRNLMRDEDGIAWLTRKYGLTNRTIEAACLGHTKRTAFTLPVYDLAGHYATLRFRRDDRCKLDGEKYFALKGYGQTRLYIPPGIRGEGRLADVLPRVVLPNARRDARGVPLPYGKRVVVLTEGEMDALALYQTGIPAVSFTNGAKALIEKGSEQLTQLAGLDCVWVAYDMDGPGQENAPVVRRLCEERGIPARVVRWDPRHGKDASEMVRKGWTKRDFQLAWWTA